MKASLIARLALFTCLATLAAIPAFALEKSMNVLFAYYPPNWGGFESSDFAPPKYKLLEGQDAPDATRSLGSTWGGAEAKAAFSIVDRVPFMVGEGGMTKGNNIRGKFSLEVSPVSVNGVGQLSLTPIAFLVFDAGAGIGTGWTAGTFRGLGINPAGNAESDIDLTPFGGAVWRVWGAGTFQFDLAAIAPGEWNHVVLLATAKAEYEANTGAGAHDAWLWEADSGENFNGAKFYGTYVLAYQMPLALNLAGIMVESEEWLGDVRDYGPLSADSGDSWGSDFRIWQIGSVMNFTLGKDDSLAVLAQFKLKPDWTDATTLNRDFRTRVYEDSYWYFNRVALSYTHQFR